MAGPVEWRDQPDAPAGELTGYAAVFGEETVIAGLFRERIAKGAFADSLTKDVRALFNHNPSVVLGRTTNGTLTLAEDDHGLAYRVQLPDTQAARDLRTLVQRGDISQSSFAFRVRTEEWTEMNAPLRLRTIVAADLYDVSPVTYPAYEPTSVSARAVEASVADGPRADDGETERARLRLSLAEAE